MSRAAPRPWGDAELTLSLLRLLSWSLPQRCTAKTDTYFIFVKYLPVVKIGV